MAPSGFLSVERHGENKCVSVSVWHKSQRTTHVHKSKRGGGGDATTPSGGSPDIWADSKSKLREQREEVLDGPHL